MPLIEGLDGIWVVESGERWWIQNNQFILIQANGAILKGEFVLKNGQMIMRYYSNNVIVALQFKLMGDLLYIRDDSGMEVQLHRLNNFRPPNNAFGGGRYIR